MLRGLLNRFDDGLELRLVAAEVSVIVVFYIIYIVYLLVSDVLSPPHYVDTTKRDLAAEVRRHTFLSCFTHQFLLHLTSHPHHLSAAQ